MSRTESLRDRRNVTILFVDIAGSTSMIENVDAESAHEIISPAIKLIIGEVNRFSGHVSNVMGDGLMAMFGVPHTLEDHAIRACLAALAIQETIAQYAEGIRQKHGREFRVRVGLNSGHVVLSVTGEGEDENYHARGSPVHLAARVESQTPPGGVGLSRHTHALVGAVFECEKLGSFSLKGFTEPEVIYRLLRMREQHVKRPQQSASTTSVPMLGRDAQRKELDEALAGLRLGSGSLVVVSGEAGAGKTRFIEECRNELGAGMLWLSGQSSSYDQRVSYWPFIEMLTGWMDLSLRAGEDQNWARLLQRMDDLFASGAEEVVPYVATLMGMEVRDPYASRVKFLDSEMLGRQILRAMRRLFGRMAADQPVVVVLDDFHWADDSTVGLVEHLIGLCTEAPIMVCITSRSDGAQAAKVLQTADRDAVIDVAQIELPPLTIEHSIELLERLMGTDVQAKSLRDQILYKAGGNPFFIEEVVRSLKSSGALVRSGRNPGAWAIAGGEISVPDTIQDVVMARVDRLDATLKQLLSVASVIGHNFLYTVLRTVAGQIDAVDGTLGELKQRQFIEEAVQLPELIYRFRHALMQESIYESLLLEQRKKLHERVADCLLDIFAGRTADVASVLAFHYARADQPDKALRYLLEAADQSVRIAADAEALKYYEDALNTSSKATATAWEPWQRATIERRLAQIHFHRGTLDVAEAHFARAFAACGTSLPATRAGLVLALLREALIQAGHRMRGAGLVSDPRALDRETEAHLLIYEPYAWLMLFMDHEKMGYSILKSLNLALKHGWPEGIAKTVSAFGAMLDILGLHGLARGYHSRACEYAEASGNPASRGMVANMFGLHEAHTGNWDKGLERLTAAYRLAAGAGDLMNASASAVYQAMILTERGALMESLALGVQMVSEGREAAFDIAVRSGLIVQGKTLWRIGQLHEAKPLLEEALRRGLASSDVIHITDAWGELCLCLCAAGEFTTAAKELARADVFMREHKVRTFSAIPIMLGLAQVEVARLDADPRRRNARAALKRCRDAVSIGRRFYFGVVPALRLMGTCCWLDGKTGQAQHWWQESLAAGTKVGAQYEIALTRIEIGKRQGLTDETRRGEAMLAECCAGAKSGALVS